MSGVRRGRTRSRQTVLRLSMKVWDAPTRLFHAAVVLLIAAGYASIRLHRLELHLLCGYAMFALLLFRLAWGFVGSETSRFALFLRSPATAFRHLAQFKRREPDDELGHAGAGGWMVLVLLALLAVDVVTGLFSNAGLAGAGPLRADVSQAASDQLGTLHAADFYLILVVTALHVLAVVSNAGAKRHNLVRPMITGRMRLPGATRQPRLASPLLALLLLALAACIVWVVASRA